MTATQPTIRCPACWHTHMPEDLYCPQCGTAVASNTGSQPATDEGAVDRKRLGGTSWQLEEPPLWSEMQPIELAPPPQRRRRKRSRKASRSLLSILLPLTVALAILAGGVGGRTLSETGSTIDKLQSVSTPPPQIGDSTVRDSSSDQTASDSVLSQLPSEPPLDESGQESAGDAGGPVSYLENDETQATNSQVQEIPAPNTGDSIASESSSALPATTSDAASSTDPSPQNGEEQAEAMLAAGLTFDTAPAVQAIAQHQQSAIGPASDSPNTSDAATSAPASDGGGGFFGSLRDKGSQVRDTAQGAAIAVGLSEPDAAPLTIMIMGVDARPGSAIDIGVRPDALMVLYLDPQAQSCRGLAIPRDSYVELPGYGKTKINHALMLGGIPYQQLVVEQYLGIEIDHYALIDFTGFAELVDAVGGVTIDVPPELASPAVAAGTPTIDGETALRHARYRGGPDGDFGRIKRQQQIMRGLIAAATGRDLLTEATRLLNGLQDHIRTDMDIDQLVSLASTYQDRCTSDGLQMEQIPGDVVYGPLIDPLFNLPLSYVVSDPVSVEEAVTRLLED